MGGPPPAPGFVAGIAWSRTALRMTGLVPTAVNTVGRATPASAAMSSIEVAR